MNNGTEKRHHPRTPVWRPVILNFAHRSMMGAISNISVGGALIFCLEPIENENEFLINLNFPKGDEMSIPCKKVWSGEVSAGNSDYNAVGILFTKISSTDLNVIIETIVSENFGV